MGALTFNAVTVSLSTDVGTVCDLIQFCKEHLWLFQVQQETMSYHTHHVHHGKSLIKSLQRKRGSVCMCVSRNICLKQKSLWIYCLASWKAQLSVGLSYLGSLKPEGKSISIRDYMVPFLSWDGIWAKVTKTLNKWTVWCYWCLIYLRIHKNILFQETHHLKPHELQ